MKIELEPEPKKEETKTEVLPSDMVTVKVLVGTLSWEKGVFQKGETFTCTRQEFSRFDPADVQILT